MKINPTFSLMRHWEYFFFVEEYHKNGKNTITCSLTPSRDVCDMIKDTTSAGHYSNLDYRDFYFCCSCLHLAI
jgi:hypothetical protein